MDRAPDPITRGHAQDCKDATTDSAPAGAPQTRCGKGGCVHAATIAFARGPVRSRRFGRLSLRKVLRLLDFWRVHRALKGHSERDVAGSTRDRGSGRPRTAQVFNSLSVSAREPRQTGFPRWNKEKKFCALA